jgi:predicted alpha/beta-hydrolase family hydrolase
MTPFEAAPFDSLGVRGFLHRPPGEPKRAMVLTHGAGANCDSPLLRTVAQVFCDSGTCVLRCDLPFRQKRASGPPGRGDAARDRAGLVDAITALRALASGPMILAGHSYGGRQASMLAAEQPDVADALLLLSYPLHPPKQPEKMRTEHFPNLRVPATFVHGTTDGFATIAELEAAAALIPAPKTVLAVDGAGHDLKRGKFDFALVLAALG